MELKIPKSFLKYFYARLYYSILPDCIIGGDECSIVLEPIFFLRIEKMKVIGWSLIEEFFDDSFDKVRITISIKQAIETADLSELEQVLEPANTNVFVLTDNTLTYPWERLAKALRKWLSVKNQENNYNGIAHFHPKEEAEFSALDNKAFKEIAKGVAQIGINQLISLIVAKGKQDGYIAKARGAESDFIEYMMDEIESAKFGAKIYFPEDSEEYLDIRICDD